jgi:N-acetylglucosaminyldiphosphoundecaprenol N-acetyl-beta-D-mannosaminyltransferase
MSTILQPTLKSTNLLGLNLQATSYEDATERILNWSQVGRSGFVCVANVHMVMEAYDSHHLQKQINQSLLTVPDGMPLVWLMRRLVNSQQTRVYGPTLMLHLCAEAARLGVPVGLYGSSPKSIERLKTNLLSIFPALKIAYSFSPPFHALFQTEDETIVRNINESGARILFVALGCPKQEQWMSEHSLVIKPIMIGVGAAFDFHAGLVRQSPALLQYLGLEWLFRLCMEPRRLWKRYFKHNPRFILLSIAKYYNHIFSTKNDCR